MNVFVNNEKHDVDIGISLESLVTLLNIKVNGIAVALNNGVVPKNRWSETVVNEDDKILIIQATAGG